MIISNTSKIAIEKALVTTNENFNDNVKFYKFESLNKTSTRFAVRLKVNESSGPGAKTSISMIRKDGAYRRSSWACWHVHGIFHDALNPDAVIRTGGLDMNHEPEVKHPGDNWVDWECGGIFNSRYASERCDCSH